MSKRVNSLPRALAGIVTLGVAAALMGAVHGGKAAPDPVRSGSGAETAAALNGLNGLTVPEGLAVGSRGTGRVSRTRPISTALEVRLQSSNPGVVSVPSTLRLSNTEVATSFRMVGNDVGCVTITATDGANTRSSRTFVYPPLSPEGAPLRLTLSAPSSFDSPQWLVAPEGAQVTGTVTRNPPGGLLLPAAVNLSSNAWNVVVPRSVSFSQGQASASFQLSVSGAPDCVVITASDGANVSRRMLRVGRMDH